MYQKQAVITGGNGEYNNQQLNKIMLCSKSLHRFHKKRQHEKIKDKNLERQITIYRNNRQQTCRYFMSYHIHLLHTITLYFTN